MCNLSRILQIPTICPYSVVRARDWNSLQLQHLLPPTGPQSFHLLTQFTTILTQSSNLPTIGEHVVPWNIELEYRGTRGGAPAQRVLRLRVDPRNGAGLRTGHDLGPHTENRAVPCLPHNLCRTWPERLLVHSSTQHLRHISWPQLLPTLSTSFSPLDTILQIHLQSSTIPEIPTQSENATCRGI